ncbi:V-snare-domain-containing protein [Neoconidiobolus thromboides FSU 785]|nr:V-snare-domain-containing protein [Neoconidiobolus thromboides FSU 785]
MNSEYGGATLFESYELEYKNLFQTLEAKIKKDIIVAQGELKKTLVRSAERECEEGEEILSQMELELNNLNKAIRSPYQARFKGYKNQLLVLKRDLKRSAQTSHVEREQLLGSEGNEQQQRSVLLSGTDRLNQSSARLENSHRLALETEQMGAGILNDLRGQREQIINTRDTLREADSSLDTAQRTLKEMARRYHIFN